jgi:putative membrane-bound dehydrogenase-like protein
VLASLLLPPCTTASAQDAEPIPHGQTERPGAALSPAEAIARMTVPEGFRVELVAGEPDLVNPVAMTFDERGRIWVTESLEYPRKEAGPGLDRVKVLEDRDRDGKAETFTIFAEGLNIPSGIAVGHGGVWVANSPDILFLQDTDGDGKADRSEVIVTGFGRADTHELPNSLTWGPDGWLYGWNGVFNPSHVDYRGRTYDFTCAIFRIHPRTRDFEVFCEGTSNPWGIAWDLEGNAFASACVIDHLWHLTETGYYHRQGGPYPPFTWKIESIVQHRHQKAAYCGIHFFDSDAYPPRYRERLFMGNIHGNGVNVDRLERNGSTYVGQEEPDFLRANDAWFMPVSQKTGPDGCLYVLDWYDRYHCYQDARRDPAGIDRLKGRLYRVRYEATPRAAAFDLAAESDEQLIGRLHSPNVFYRDLAQRLLAERNRPATNERLEALVLDDTVPRKARMHALWARIGAGPPSTGFLASLLAHPDAGFRAWGVRAAGNLHRAEASIRDRIVALARDSSPDVRLQVAVAARKLRGLDPLSLLLDVLAHAGDDPLIPQIVWQNLHPLIEDQGEALVDLVERPEYRASEPVVRVLPRAAERLLGRRGRDPRRRIGPVVDLVSSLGATPTPTPLPGAASASASERVEATRRIFELLAGRVQSGEIAGEALQALRRGLRPVVQPRLDGPDDDPLAIDAALLATSWDDQAARARARRAFLGASRARAYPQERRLQALRALIAARDPSILDAAAEVATARDGTAEFRGQVLSSLSRLDDPRVAAVVLDRYPGLDAEVQPRAVELLTERPAWSLALLEAIGAGKVPADALNLNQIRKLLASKHAALVQQVRARFGTVREERNPAREAVIARMRRLLQDRPGDPHAGAEVFKKLCAQCHKIHGEGQEVGPDLTLNGRGSYEQLLSNVLDPSLVIGSAYQATTVATTDGRVLTGLVAEESPERLVLKTQGGKLETIPRGDIEERKLSPLSLMPEDLEKQLTEAELADLFAFLTLDKHPRDATARPIAGTPERKND